MISPGGQAELLLLPADVCLGTDCQLPVGGKNAACLPGSHLSLSLQTFYRENQNSGSRYRGLGLDDN